MSAAPDPRFAPRERVACCELAARLRDPLDELDQFADRMAGPTEVNRIMFCPFCGKFVCPSKPAQGVKLLEGLPVARGRVSTGGGWPRWSYNFGWSTRISDNGVGDITLYLEDGGGHAAADCSVICSAVAGPVEDEPPYPAPAPVTFNVAHESDVAKRIRTFDLRTGERVDHDFDVTVFR